MSQPAAKFGDRISATDSHMAIVPGTPPTQVLQKLKFNGVLTKDLSKNVRINGRAAATVGSSGKSPPHSPLPPATAFVTQPSNTGKIVSGSRKVRINGQPAARHDDVCTTCNDAADAQIGKIVASSNVRMA
jgi:uncharacterized Zn-binding protein involved in type VI secretion